MVHLCDNTDDIDVVYLPSYLSMCSCYASYLDRLGYSITTFNDGNYKVGSWSGEVGEDAAPYVSLPTFYNVWKCDFAHIKVSRPTEDMCTLWFQFMNHHKYSIGILTDSLTDSFLFFDTPNNKGESDDEEGEDLVDDDDGAEEEEDMQNDEDNDGCNEACNQ